MYRPRGLSRAAFLALHGLRLKGCADAPHVAELLSGVTPVDAGEVEVELKDLADHDLVTWRDGLLRGWRLTAEGKAEHARLLEAELGEAGTRAAIESAYEAFLPVNRRLLAVCVRWQVKDLDGENRVNEHDDPAYDQDVLAELDAVHAEVQPILGSLESALSRFGLHQPRLARALAEIHRGNHDYVTKAVLDTNEASYHTAWFELHEDLLVTLGRQRTSEPTD